MKPSFYLGYSDLAAKTIDGEVLDVIDAQPLGSTVTYTFSGATDYNFALGIGIKLTNNTTAALLIGDDGNIVWNRKSGGYWRGWKTAITNSDLAFDGTIDSPVQGMSIIKSTNGFTICRKDGDYAAQLQLNWWDGLRIRVKTGSSWGAWTAK